MTAVATDALVRWLIFQSPLNMLLAAYFFCTVATAKRTPDFLLKVMELDNSPPAPSFFANPFSVNSKTDFPEEPH